MGPESCGGVLAKGVGERPQSSIPYNFWMISFYHDSNLWGLN